jgi:hypothetical protein
MSEPVVFRRAKSELEGRGADWTEERGSLRPSDEGRMRRVGGMGRRAGPRKGAGR